MVTLRSSSGWRITSRTLRLNSGNSSKNNTPLWASDISPGCGLLPPPTKATSEIVWWGDLNGLTVTKASAVESFPATEWIFVVSSDSYKLKGGKIDGSLLARIVFPAPGGPIKITLCPPAAAISKARLIFSCPFTSLKSLS